MSEKQYRSATKTHILPLMISFDKPLKPLSMRKIDVFPRFSGGFLSLTPFSAGSSVREVILGAKI
jgi:hypothetical protein